MNRILKTIIIAITAYLFLAYALPKIIGNTFALWNSSELRSENSKIIKKGRTEELDKIITKKLNENPEFNPELALNSIIELYQKNKNMSHPEFLNIQKFGIFCANL